jgi:hypothetical protein
MKQIFSALVLLCICYSSNAQVFFTPVQKLKGPAIVTTVAGKEVNGELVSAQFATRGVSSIKMIDSATGVETSYNAEDIKSVKVMVNKNSAMEKLGKQTKSLFGLRKGTENLLVRDYIEFDQVKYPEEKDKILLLELLNNDFSSKVQVYDHRVGAKLNNGMSLWDKGEESLSYIIVVNGEASFVEKKKYKSLYFDKLFASCPELMAMPEKEVNFSDFAKHVSIFDKCK